MTAFHRTEVVKIILAAFQNAGISFDHKTEASMREKCALAGVLPVWYNLRLGQGAYADEQAVRNLVFDLWTQQQYEVVQTR